LQTLPQFEVLFESARDALPLPAALARAYGGVFWLPRDCAIANFVESVDGVVAFPEAGAESGGIVSGGSDADRLLMGLLRACADAVLIGAGTLRAAPQDLWFPESIFGEAAPLFAEIRRALGLQARPALYVVSGSGRVDPAHPALRAGGAVLRGKLQPGEIIGTLRRDGHRRILCEGGPGLFAELVAAKLVDEMFLTLSPRLFGRWEADRRKALTDGRDLTSAHLELSSLRRQGSHLFLRYRLAR
jgi:riboflavin biosynthesis pyrimidine reductase